MSHLTNPLFWFRPARGRAGHVLEIGRYRQQFWKPLIRSTQHGERRPAKIHKGKKP